MTDAGRSNIIIEVKSGFGTRNNHQERNNASTIPDHLAEYQGEKSCETKRKTTHPSYQSSKKNESEHHFRSSVSQVAIRSLPHLLSHLVFPHSLMLLALSFGDGLVQLVQELLCLVTVLEHAHERLDLLAFGGDADLDHLGSLDHVQRSVEQSVEVQTDLARWIGTHENTGLGGFLGSKDADRTDALADP